MSITTLNNGDNIVIKNSETEKILVSIVKHQENKCTVLVISGAIKTNVASEFSGILMRALEQSELLVLDFSDVSYIASAGLRALLTAQQYIDDNDGITDMVIKNINDEVRDVFESTGFINILNVDE